jgi:hypothetical protein
MREGRFGKANGGITMGDMARPKSLWAMWLGKIARWLRGQRGWAEVVMGDVARRSCYGQLDC